jgi:tetratricopeptide (TPR) repeat protein
VRLLRGDPAGALERLEAGLARWPDNAPARAAAGRAAQEIGDTARAFEHYRQAIRSDARATDAALAAAFLARALGRPQEAADYLSYHVTNRPYTDARTLVFAIESARAAGNELQAEQFLEMIEQHAERGNASAVAALAGLERRRSGAAGALRRIDAGKLDLRDPKHEPALRARLDLLLELGDAEAALAAIDRALAGHPEEPSFLDLRARVLGVLGRTDEARASFQRALAANPGHAPSLAGLGALEVEAGDLPNALSYFDRAATADSADAESAYRAAQLVLARGDAPEAERRLRALLAVTPVHAGACNDLAWILAEGGRDLDLALELARRAALLSPQPSADVADTLAFVQLTRGEAQAALSTLEAAVKDHPRSGLLRYRQGLAHARLGDSEAALEAFREALRDASFREGEAARAQIARLEAQTPPSSRP